MRFQTNSQAFLKGAYLANLRRGPCLAQGGTQ